MSEAPSGAKGARRARGIWGAAGAAVALGIAVWWQLPGDAPPSEPRADTRTGAEVEAETSAPEAPAPAAAVAPAAAHIPASGRLAIRTQDLPGSAPLVLSLGLSDEAIGDGPRPVRIVAEDGRTLDATASPEGEAGSGVRVEIDPQWLRPGRYMIEVKTAEKSHFPLRRYVLEIR